MWVNSHGDEYDVLVDEVTNDGVALYSSCGVDVIINTIPLQLLSLGLLTMSFGSGRDSFNNIIRSGKRKGWAGMGDDNVNSTSGIGARGVCLLSWAWVDVPRDIERAEICVARD